MKKIIQIIFFLSSAINQIGYTQHWSPLLEGINNQINDFYVDTIDNVLYITGKFATAGNVTVNGITIWDGEQFYALGTGMDGCVWHSCGNVSGSVMRYKDEMYFGIGMNSVSGLPVSGIARWNGMEWNTVGEGVRFFDGDKGSVGDMIVWNGDLYVGGGFNIAGQDTAHAVARWDGENWHPVDFPKNSFGYVSDLLAFNDELYVAGNFGVDDGNGWYFYDIMKFDGNEWYLVAGGSLGGVMGAIKRMIEYQGELYIAGLISVADGNPGNGILKLEGDQWVAVGGSFNHPYHQIFDMVIFNDKLYVVGGSMTIVGGQVVDFIAVWDGENWEGVEDEFDNRVTAAVVYNDALIVGGGFNHINGEPIKRIAKWHCTDPSDNICESLPVRLEEINSRNSITISPNPASHELRVSLSGGYENQTFTLSIFNILGELLFEQRGFDPGEAVDVSGLASGTYILQLQSGEEALARKFVVQR